MKKLNVVAISVALLVFSAQAQNSRYISLEEAVLTAVENSDNIKIAKLDIKIANANYRQTDAIFLPQIDLGYTALSTNNPLNAFGFLLQQESVTQMDFDPAKLNNPGASQNYNAQIEAKMPLFNLDMVYARKGAKAQEEMYKYKAQRTKEYIEFEVKKAYTQLQMAYQAQRILQEWLNDVKQIHSSVSNFYDQGLVQKSDVLNAQVQVNTIESALAKASSNIQNASDGLSLLMGNDKDSHTLEADSLQQSTTLQQNNTQLTYRSDIMALNKALDATDMMVKSSKMAFLPHINAFGSYGWNDDKIFGFKADSYLVGIKMSWNIFSGNQDKSKLQSARFQRDKMQEEVNFHIKQSQIEIDKTKRDLNDSQIEINKQKSSVEQAAEALRILTNRYREGLVSTTDLLMAQAQLSKQKLQLSQAVMTYNITEAYLSFLSE